MVGRCESRGPIKLQSCDHAICACDPKIERRKGHGGFRDVPAGSSSRNWIEMCE
jgi:hypothetical protein